MQSLEWLVPSARLCMQTKEANGHSRISCVSSSSSVSDTAQMQKWIFIAVDSEMSHLLFMP